MYSVRDHASIYILPLCILACDTMYIYYLYSCTCIHVCMYIIQRRVFSHWFSWLTSSAGKGAADEMDRLLREVRVVNCIYNTVCIYTILYTYLYMAVIDVMLYCIIGIIVYYHISYVLLLCIRDHTCGIILHVYICHIALYV